MLFLEETYSEAEPFDWDSSLREMDIVASVQSRDCSGKEAGGRRQLCVSCPLTTNPINHINLKTN